MQVRRKPGGKKARKTGRAATRGGKTKAPRKPAKARVRPAATKAARPKAKRPVRQPAKTSAARPPRPRAARARVAPPAPRHPLGFLQLHVSFNTRAYEELIAFFRDRIGLPLQTMEEMGYANVDVCQGGSLGFMRGRPPEGGETAPFGASEAGIYVMCADVAFVHRTLTERGISFEGPPADQPWGHRTIRTTDPEGRSLVFAQAIGN